MDRNGERWTGDEIDADARARATASDDPGRRTSGDGDEAVSTRRAIGTAAKGQIRLEDDGDAPVTAAGGGAGKSGESDEGRDDG